jgi:hypothetical protein
MRIFCLLLFVVFNMQMSLVQASEPVMPDKLDKVPPPWYPDGPQDPPYPLPPEPYPEPPIPFPVSSDECCEQIERLRDRVEMLENRLNELERRLSQGVVNKSTLNQREYGVNCDKVLKRVKNAVYNYNFDYNKELVLRGSVEPFRILVRYGYLPDVPKCWKQIRVDEEYKAKCVSD